MHGRPDLKEGTQTIYTYLMETMANDKNTPCDGLTEAQEDLARDLLERIAGKWPLAVLFVLWEAGNPLRFSRVLEQAEGVSQKVLTQTLRHLERDGLVSRRLYAQVPPRVDYALTALGQEFLLQILPLGRWITDRVGQFEAARQSFDEEKAAGKN